MLDSSVGGERESKIEWKWKSRDVEYKLVSKKMKINIKTKLDKSKRKEKMKWECRSRNEEKAGVKACCQHDAGAICQLEFRAPHLRFIFRTGIGF